MSLAYVPSTSTGPLWHRKTFSLWKLTASAGTTDRLGSISNTLTQPGTPPDDPPMLHDNEACEFTYFSSRPLTSCNLTSHSDMHKDFSLRILEGPKCSEVHSFMLAHLHWKRKGRVGQNKQLR
jgi:hypothetical protein